MSLDADLIVDRRRMRHRVPPRGVAAAPRRADVLKGAAMLQIDEPSLHARWFEAEPRSS